MGQPNDRGLVIAYTGNGKGKTTAALGLCIRALGHGNKCLIIQFIKSNWEYGELKGVSGLGSNVEIRPMGVGCFGMPGDETPRNEHRRAARRALETARDEMVSGGYEVIVLDEIFIATHYGLIGTDDVLDMITQKPDAVNLVLTGRYADQEILDIADLVTEMREIKHPYHDGMLSKKGIDY
jgi:cob(I)alamin adenosyltransferase